MEKNINELLLKPDEVKSYDGWKKINGLKKAFTNVTERNYGYLASMLGVKDVEAKAMTGVKYIRIGERAVNGDIELKDKETLIDINDDGIIVYGLSAEEVSLGVKMLLDMKRVAGEADVYPVGVFGYVPKMKMRAVHMCIFRPDDGTEKEDTSIENLRRRIKKAALCGYNYVFLEFWGMFPYEKREYAHWKNCYTREEVNGLISLIIDDLHMTPVPVQNLTSHAGWSRITSRKHVVLDQRPDLADMWIPGGWCFATTRDDTKAYLKDIIEDLVKTFRTPPILHCSCDKCFGFGSTEEERTVPADDLFVNHLNFLHDELAKYGVRMAMWSDMLYSSMDVKYWKCDEKVADRLPKDILMNIWTHKDIGDGEWKDISFFESKGYETIYSPFLDKKGAKNMAEQCLKHGSAGILQTTWHKPETAMETVVYSGGYLWTGKEPEAAVVDAALKYEG